MSPAGDVGMAAWVDSVVRNDRVWDDIAANPEFGETAQWFDTTIVLESDEHAMFFKVYRGGIIDRGRGHGFQGYVFALSASDDAWREVVTKGSRELHRALNHGEVRVRGNLIEFNRAIKMLSVMFDQIMRTGAAA